MPIVSAARLRALPTKITTTARQARDRCSDLISQARRAVFGQHGHHVVAPVALPVTVAPPVTAGPFTFSAWTSGRNSLDSSHEADDAGDSTIASESENRQYGSVHEFDESSYGIGSGAPEKAALDTLLATPPSQLIMAFAALHQKVQALVSALNGAGPQHVYELKQELVQLELEADELMATAQARPQAEKQAAKDHYLNITDTIDTARTKLDMQT